MIKKRILYSVSGFIMIAFIGVIITAMRPASAKQAVELLIDNGTIITMDKGRIIEHGSIAVHQGKIVAIGSSQDISGSYSSKQVIHAEGKLVIPGLINTHNHAAMSLFRGISDDVDLNDWLTKFIFPAEAKNVNPEFVRAGTRLSLAEMIKGGTTTYCDMYYFEEEVADETAKAGMRAVLGETIIDFKVNDNETPLQALAYAEKFIAKWKGNALINPALAPHAPYTVSQQYLEKITSLSAKLNAPVIIHVSETQAEVDKMTQQTGLSPIRYLEKIGFLTERVIAAHVVVVNDDEISILKNHGVGLAHNPSSNMKLASGVAPVTHMLAKGCALGLGTDGCASNNDMSLWEEMDMAAKLHKVATKDPKAVSAEQAFSMATIGGARALHLDDKTGSLEAGKLADIVIVDTDNLHQTPFYNYYSLLVYSTKASDVSSVIINGKLVLQDKKLLTLDESEIKKTANAWRDKIRKNLSEK